MVHRIARKQFYVVSDPDVIPDEQCLKTAYIIEGRSGALPELHKVGWGSVLMICQIILQ